MSVITIFKEFWGFKRWREKRIKTSAAIEANELDEAYEQLKEAIKAPIRTALLSEPRTKQHGTTAALCPFIPPALTVKY